MQTRLWMAALWLGAIGCNGVASNEEAGETTSASLTASSSEDTTATTTASTGTTTDADTSSDSGPKLDVAQETEGSDPACKVQDGLDAVGPCEEQAPPNSFVPDVQWEYIGEVGDQIAVSPVVANLTDDNDDGQIDLCDIPDIVVTIYNDPDYHLSHAGAVTVLDGATGARHFAIADYVTTYFNPAIGDIDGDGLPEIVTANWPFGRLVAFEHDGELKWTGDAQLNQLEIAQHGIALADLDNDGDVEIMAGGLVADHNGEELWRNFIGFDGVSQLTLTTAADLDGDDDLEVIYSYRAYHHDGTIYYGDNDDRVGHAQVADLDDDGLPEILVVDEDAGITVLEHDGTIKYPLSHLALSEWRPAAIHDVDGDLAPEVVVGASNSYSLLEADLTPVWTTAVLDASGYAAGTAFDFLGDGSAEAMYADETQLFIFGDGGVPLLTEPRESWTMVENPVVADVDNDGSAEIVVVSNRGYNDATAPPIKVIRDAEDRWVPARRIWNQHTYHVTNVREDATIPQVEPKHWLSLNTFRTQAQVEGGGVCKPEPEG